MRHFAIAAVIGLLTIGISIFVLSDSDTTYEADSKVDRTIAMGELVSVDNYDLKPISLDCYDHESIDGESTQHGCVLNVELTNTTVFEQLLVLDGDRAITSDGKVYESSDDLSKQFIADNGLTNEVDIEETVSGGIFFDVPAGVAIDTIEIFETASADPIIVEI